MNTAPIKIGDYLKKIRLEKDVELESIAKETRISLSVLRDLEATKLSSLPSQAYVRGFVSNYLKCLKVGNEEALKLLDQAYGEKTPQFENAHEKPVPTPKTKTKSKSKTKSRPNFTFDIHNLANKKVLVVVVALFLIFGFFKIFNHLLSGVNQTTKEVVESMPVEEATPEAILSSTTTSSTTSSTTTTTTTTLEEKKLSNFPFVKFNKIKKAYYTIDSLDASAEIPPEYRRKDDGSNSLYVRASFGDCWLRYKVDGAAVKSFILKEGRELHLTGDIFYLNFGSVGNIEIFYNDRVVDAPSKTGFKLMVLPKEEATNHEYPIFADDKQNVPHFYIDYKEKMDPAPEEPLE